MQSLFPAMSQFLFCKDGTDPLWMLLHQGFPSFCLARSMPTRIVFLLSLHLLNIVQKETALVKTSNKKSKDQRTFAFIMLYNYLSALAAACTRALRRDFLRAAVFL